MGLLTVNRLNLSSGSLRNNYPELKLGLQLLPRIHFTLPHRHPPRERPLPDPVPSSVGGSDRVWCRPTYDPRRSSWRMTCGRWDEGKRVPGRGPLNKRGPRRGSGLNPSATRLSHPPWYEVEETRDHSRRGHSSHLLWQNVVIVRKRKRENFSSLVDRLSYKKWESLRHSDLVQN